MNTLGIISIAVIAVSGIFAAYRQFQMLQQNSYFLSRYFKWVKGNFLFRSFLSCALLITSLISVIFKLNFLAVITAVFSLIRINTAVFDDKKSIKKLVLTARVKRTFICYITVSVLLFLLGFVNSYLFIISLVTSFVPSILICVSVILMSPAEKIIKNYYTNDAVHILNGINDLFVIGVTGSYGKTSTKYVLGRILSEKFNTVITPQSFNTPLGIVRTVRESVKPQTEVFVAEMGAKNVGDIKEICNIAHPNLAIITSVGPQHLDTFKTINNVISTKFELADECLKNNGTVFLNTDNEYIAEKATGLNGKIITYGTDSDCDYRATDINYSRYGVSFKVVHNNQTVNLSSRLLGVHNALNITGAVAIAKELGISDKDIAFAVSKLNPVEHRLEMKNYINSSILIDDAYNANPAGCIEAVKVLGSFEGMKKIIVTPGLIELGEKEYECNKNLGIEAAKHCDIIITVGKKRSVPILDGVNQHGFDQKNIFVAESFKDAVSIFSPLCDKNTVILFENDLPDNYAG